MAKSKRKYYPATGEKTKHFSVTVRKSTLKQIDAAARKAGVSRSNWLISAAETKLKIVVAK